MDEEQTRKFLEEEGPWNNGGKQAALGGFQITMTHDELAVKMGVAYQVMLDAGFVMVPKKWRQTVNDWIASEGRRHANREKRGEE